MLFGVDSVGRAVEQRGHRFQRAEPAESHPGSPPVSESRRAVQIKEVLVVGQELREAVGARLRGIDQGRRRAHLAAALRDGEEGPDLMRREEDRALAVPGSAAGVARPGEAGDGATVGGCRREMAPGEEADPPVVGRPERAVPLLGPGQRARRSGGELLHPDPHRAGALPRAEGDAAAVVGERRHAGAFAVELDRDAGGQRQSGPDHPRRRRRRAGPAPVERRAGRERDQGQRPGNGLAAAGPGEEGRSARSARSDRSERSG